jgi:hypothetical protein
VLSIDKAILVDSSFIMPRCSCEEMTIFYRLSPPSLRDFALPYLVVRRPPCVPATKKPNERL